MTYRFGLLLVALLVGLSAAPAQAHVGAAPPGFVTVLSATSSSASVTGIPFDRLNFPVTVSATPPMELKTTRALVLASSALCHVRAGCKKGTGPAWPTVKPSYIRRGDRLAVTLNTSYQTAYSDLKAHLPVPTSLIYDFGGS
jgi:hypothetical protein